MAKGRSRSPAAYAVGYRKPPRSTQFKPGQSGNKKGRPKGSKNLASSFWKALDKRVPVQADGIRKQISKREAFFIALINQALAGDAKARSDVLRAMTSLQRQDEIAEAAPAPAALTESDELVMADILRRIRTGEVPPAPDQPAPPAAPGAADPSNGNNQS